MDKSEKAMCYDALVRIVDAVCFMAGACVASGVDKDVVDKRFDEIAKDVETIAEKIGGFNGVLEITLRCLKNTIDKDNVDGDDHV